MKPKEGPWTGNTVFYIDAEDLDAYCRKTRDAGGKIVVERLEVPGVGALALFEDSEGGVVGMWQQNK